MKTKLEAITRKIPRNTYIMALGLFQLATAASRRAQECEKELSALLKTNDYGHVSDAIWSGGTTTFDEALAKENIVVLKEKAKCKPRKTK